MQIKLANMARREPITRPQAPEPLCIPITRPTRQPKSHVKIKTNTDDFSDKTVILLILLPAQLYVINSDDFIVSPVQDQYGD